MKRNFIISIVLLISVSYKCGAQNKISDYQIISKIPVTGDGEWDYPAIDATTGRLYITHENIVQILDLKSQKILATINDTKGANCVALAKKLNKGFISCGHDTSVKVIDLLNFDMKERIKVTGLNPNSLVYDSTTDKLFCFNTRGSNVTVIDATTNKVINTIVLPGKPEYAVTDDKGIVYVNIKIENKIVAINTTSLKIINSWSIAPGENPNGLAIDKKNNLLFTSCENKLLVISKTDESKVIATAATGNRSKAVCYDPSLERIFCANADSTLTILQKENLQFRIIKTLTTQKGSRTMVLNPLNHELYIPAAEFDSSSLPTAENPDPRSVVRADSFIIMVIAP